MKRNLMILALMGVFAFMAVPAFNAVNAQNRDKQKHSQSRDSDWNRRNDSDWNSRNRSVWGKSHKKNAHGYRNYGQYRRTQVGNRRTVVGSRRSHLVRRYYTSADGTRLSRLVRVFY